MRRSAMVLLLSIAALTGCIRTSTTMLGSNTPRPKLDAEQVKVFLSEKDVPGDFEKIALISAEGASGWTDENRMIEAARKKAGELGANGIIINEIKEPSAGAKVAGAVFGVAATRHGSIIAIFYTAPNN